ncbi:MAG: response regulator transcription factor [Clostridia bacterium]|nr:response regulator transcription factor [Clostridia bacterium]
MKLLLAEDEKELSRAITRVLEFNQYTVDTVYDGMEALTFLANSSYDGVVLDVRMPKKDGLSVVREMRANGNHTPVLILTAKAEIDDKVEGLDAGADDYLTKPFAIKELLARIRALVRRQGDIIECHTIGNITLHPDTFVLSAVGEARLTNTEYRLIEYLIRNRGILLSTEKIMENVWSYDTNAERNVVWVFISTLRKKLESIGADHTIKAVRGVGYSLEPVKGIKVEEGN